MTRLGRTWGLATAGIACAALIALAGCGTSDEGDPPGATSGDVEPIGELAGPTVPLEDDEFTTLLSLTVNATSEGRTLVAGQLALKRPTDIAEVRILVDGEEERSAEARQAPGGGALVIACACELEAGEHEIELQGQSASGLAPILARSLIALDGVEYASDPASGSGALPPALAAAVFETRPVLVSGAATTLADANISSAATAENTLILAQIGSTRSVAETSGIAMNAGLAGEEATRLASLTSASTKIDAFVLDRAPASGETVELVGNVVGGGSTELDLISLIVCPCGLETES